MDQCSDAEFQQQQQQQHDDHHQQNKNNGGWAEDEFLHQIMQSVVGM